MRVLNALLLGAAIAEAASRGIASALAARDLLRQLEAEGRDPTDDEWEALTDASAALHRAIQQA